MSAHEYRILFVCLAILVVFWGSIVMYQEFAHPAARAADYTDLSEALGQPKTSVGSQLIYAKDDERQWADANSGDRSKALPAWSKILDNFRLNVVGSGADAATSGLKNSESWYGKITGDQALDARLIEAAVMTRLYREGQVWTAIQKNLKDAAPNEVIDKTLSDNKF